jgi:Bacterial Ig-like domain (group 2)
MSSMKQRVRLIGAIAALATLALAISCTGFFVKPTLTAIAVGPVSPTIFTGTVSNTVQMFAVGTFNDGSSSSSTPVTWSISGTGTNGQTIATISTSGLVTAQDVGTGTITASSDVLPSITGTQPLTVSVACTTAPIIGPTTSGTITPNAPSISFTASCGGQDITSVATWFSSNTAIATVSAGVVTAVGGASNNGTFYITASSNGFTSSRISITASGF